MPSLPCLRLRRARRATTTLALGVLLICVMAPPAGAHTAPVPLEIDPVPGSEVDRVPDDITLRFDGDFTEDVDASLLDAAGQAIPSDVRVEGRTLRVRPRDAGSLPDGTYRISWYARTTHGSDAPDGIGAESRQTHFFVGAESSGEVIFPDTGTGEDSNAVPFFAVALVVVVSAGSLLVIGHRGRRLVISLAIGAASALGGMVLASDTDAGRAGHAWTATTEDGTTVRLSGGDEWNLQINDGSGLATPWATGVQLRFTDPDSSGSAIVDLEVDISTLGRFDGTSPAGVDGWETELVISTFEGPVHNYFVTVP